MRSLEKSTRLCVVERANIFNLDVYKDDIKELLKVCPEKFTKEELLKLRKDHIALESGGGNTEKTVLEQ